MTKRPSFTTAEIKRALTAARAVDPQAVLKLALDGSLQILPYVAEPAAIDPTSAKVSDFFARHDKAS
jgi:hypothetical protein